MPEASAMSGVGGAAIGSKPSTKPAIEQPFLELKQSAENMREEIQGKLNNLYDMRNRLNDQIEEYEDALWLCSQIHDASQPSRQKISGDARSRI